MPVFYRGPRALITHQVIEIPFPAHRILALCELAELQAVQEGLEGVDRRHRVLGVSALGSVLLVVPVVGRASLLLSIVCGLILALYAGACLRVRSEACFRLLAVAGGEWVVLVETADRFEFGQISRALQRAMDYQAEQH